MKKAFYLLTILVLSVSCKAMIDPIRIPVEGTSWSYSTDDQTARVCFQDNRHVSIIQLDYDSGNIQSEHGTYDLDGHSVLCKGNDWSKDVKFVRTFSHLKNSSTNKNLTPVSPQSYSTIEGSIWAGLVNRNLQLVYFIGNGNCLQGTFSNVIHEEGVPYGWEWSKKSFTHTGSQVEAGSVKGTLYDRFMALDTLAVMVASYAPESEGTSALTGTVWTYDGGGYPGVIIFTSDAEFTRVFATSKIVHEVKTGTYKLEGTSLTMTLDGKNETCQLEGGRFTFFDKTYAKVTLP